MPLRKGFIHVYTGNGKGKTSAALGLCLRAAGRGLKCCFIQFIKGKKTGEMEAIKKLENIEFIQTGRHDYDFNVTEEDYKRARKGLEIAHKKLKEFDVVVLDEINVAVHLGLIGKEELLNLIRNKPEKVELILTGRFAKREIVEIADYVTEFQLIKHPFYRGESAREGIDY